jgi:hypothetical protein
MDKAEGKKGNKSKTPKKPEADAGAADQSK